MSNLILTICSNAKLPNDTAQKYDVGTRKITYCLPNLRERIDVARKLAFLYITKENREWQFLSVAPSNNKLKCGLDIFPENEETDAVYMPALMRYSGRFYGEFKKVVGDVYACIKRLNGDSEDHLLIVSGLYGLLTPTELIQDYNCNVPEERNIRELWKHSDLLTDIVTAYMSKYNINRVFDFMAEDSYRHLIDWNRIENIPGCEVFYSHSSFPREGEQVGVNLLPRLGHAAGLLLREKPEIRLSDIRSGRTVGASGIKIKSTPPRWIPAGTSLSEQEMYAVWATRMVINIETFLDEEDVSRTQGKRRRQTIERIKDKEFSRRYKSVSEHMCKINDFRNDVVHESKYAIESAEIEEIRQCYGEVVNWASAEARKYHPPKDVDY